MDFLHADDDDYDDDTDAVPAETLMAMQEHGKVWASALVLQVCHPASVSWETCRVDIFT